jgi:hypothetical protein
MGGNVYQWEDTTFNAFGYKVVRGGHWGEGPDRSAASFRGVFYPTRDDADIFGFRVAGVGGVPEPSTGLLAVLACGIMWWCRKRSKLRD